VDGVDQSHLFYGNGYGYSRQVATAPDEIYFQYGVYEIPCTDV
jgi:hypothetical protein